MRRAISATCAAVSLVVGLALPASAFEPPADPQNRSSCPGGNPVPGHPGFPGIDNGRTNSTENTGGRAVAAWSAAFNSDQINFC